MGAHMPSFRLIPAHEPEDYSDFTGIDASAALNVASSQDVGEADVYQDGHYVFSIRRSGLTSGCWIIQTKASLLTPAMPQFAPGNPPRAGRRPARPSAFDDQPC
jgi:hypothetical protein